MPCNHKHILLPVILCIAILFTCCATPGNGNTGDVPTGKQQQATPPATNYSVYFINESAFPNAGFVRQPLFAGAFEPNIFVYNTKGSNTLRVSLDSETELFYSGDSHVKYYLHTGDTVYLRDNPQPQPRAPYVLVSNNAANNTVTGFYQSTREQKLPLLYAEMANQLNGFIHKQKDNSFAALYTLYQRSLQYAGSYFAKHRPEAGFEDFIKNDLRFDHYSKLFTYAGERQIDSLIRSHYFAFDADTGSLFFEAESAYQGALYSYMMYTIRKQYKNPEPGLDLVMHTADSLYQPEAAALIKFIYLRNNINRLYPAQEKGLKLAIAGLGNRPFARILTEKITQTDFSSVNANKLEAPDGKTYTLDQVIKANAGKVIYLDIWASWCVPCQQAFVHYPALLTQLDTASTSVILLSVDQSKEAWLKARARLKLPQQVQHYLLLSPGKEVLKSMDALTIPRYKIYDKSGRIYNNDAPGPGDKQLAAIVTDLVKK